MNSLIKNYKMSIPIEPSLKLRNKNCQHLEHLLQDSLCPSTSQYSL